MLCRVVVPWREEECSSTWKNSDGGELCSPSEQEQSSSVSVQPVQVHAKNRLLHPASASGSCGNSSSLSHMILFSAKAKKRETDHSSCLKQDSRLQKGSYD